MKKRLLSGIIITALFITFYLLGGIYFVAFMGFVSILAYKEIAFLKKYPSIVIIFGLISMLSIVILNSAIANYFLGFKYISLLVPLILLTIPSLLPKYQNEYLLSDAFSLIGFIIFVGMGISTLNTIVLTNKIVLLYLIAIVCLNDIFAYLIGKLIGKHKFSKISPNKTIEGIIAGNIFGLTGGTIFYLIFINNQINIFFLIFVTLILTISGQLGDLIFSKIKRENNIKDFSKLIPGHGGILDRLDSLLFTSLVYLVFILLF